MGNKKGKGDGSLKVLKRLVAQLKQNNIWLVLTVIVSILAGFSAILLAKGTKGMADAAIGHNMKILVSFLYMVIAALVLEVTAGVAKTYFSGKYASKGMQQLRRRSQEHITDLPVPYMDNHNSGDLISRFSNDMNELQSFIGSTLSDIISSSILFVVSLTYLFILNWKLTFVSGIVLPLLTMAVMKISNRVDSQAKKRQESFSRESNVLQDSISGLTEIKSFVLEDIMQGKYDKEVHSTVKNSAKLYFLDALVMPIGMLCYILPFILTMFFGGFLVFRNEITFGGLLAYISLSNYVVDPIAGMPRLITSLRASAASVKRIFEIWDVPMEREDGKAWVSHVEPGDSIIEFNNVLFTYSEGEQLFKNLSFKIGAGETVALVGASGCGKSSVLKLVTGFYQPQEGSIHICGHDIREWKLSSMRTLMAEVLQDTYLFPDTIYQNITFGKPDASNMEIEEAVKSAGILNFIQKLPDKSDTTVGERGIKLSGGQKQKVAIARALLKNAPILLLDEATSSLDNQSEYEVQQALERLMKGRTSLIIAHRLSTIKNATRILVIADGSIAESGNHEELLARNGLYSQLYYNQFSALQPHSTGDLQECS